MGVSLNGGFSPQIIHFNRVFHYFHLSFWGTPSCGGTPISPYPTVNPRSLVTPRQLSFLFFAPGKRFWCCGPLEWCFWIVCALPRMMQRSKRYLQKLKVERSRWNFWSYGTYGGGYQFVCSQNATITRSLALFFKLEKSLEKENFDHSFSCKKRCSLTRSGPTNGTCKPCPAIWGKVFWV